MDRFFTNTTFIRHPEIKKLLELYVLINSWNEKATKYEQEKAYDENHWFGRLLINSGVADYDAENDNLIIPNEEYHWLGRILINSGIADYDAENDRWITPDGYELDINTSQEFIYCEFDTDGETLKIVTIGNNQCGVEIWKAVADEYLPDAELQGKVICEDAEIIYNSQYPQAMFYYDLNVGEDRYEDIIAKEMYEILTKRYPEEIEINDVDDSYKLFSYFANNDPNFLLIAHQYAEDLFEYGKKKL